MLRRQQLNRVAEWVQNNSKLVGGSGNNNGSSNNESDTENLIQISHPEVGTLSSDNINNNNNSNNGKSSTSLIGDSQKTIPKMNISSLVVSDKQITSSDTQTQPHPVSN
jgi:hypothetical protein